MALPLLAFAGAGALLGGGLSALGIGNQNDSYIEAYKAQMKALMTNYNYQVQAINAQEVSARDRTISQLNVANIQGMSTLGTLRASQAESGYEGRTANQQTRVVEGSIASTRQSIKDQYADEITSLNSKKDALYISTKSQANSARAITESQLTSGTDAFLKVAQGAVTGALAGYSIGGIANAGLAAGTTVNGVTQSFTSGVSEFFKANAGLFAGGSIASGILGAGISR